MFKYSNMLISFLIPILFLISIASAEELIGESESDPLHFYWSFTAENDLTQPVCSIMEFTVYNATNGSHPIVGTPPYYLQMFPMGVGVAQTYAIDHNDFFENDRFYFNYTLPFPRGVNFMSQMVDSMGHSGGVGRLYSVSPHYDNDTEIIDPNCVPALPVASELQFTQTLSEIGGPKICEKVPIQITGGQAPYTLTVIKSMDRALNYSIPSNQGYWTCDLTAGSGYLMTVTDVNGMQSNVSALYTSMGGTDFSCLINNSGNLSGSTIGGIAAGISVAAIILVSIGWYFWYRRRHRHREQQIVERHRRESEKLEKGFMQAGGDDLSKRADSSQSYPTLRVDDGNAAWKEGRRPSDVPFAITIPKTQTAAHQDDEGMYYDSPMTATGTNLPPLPAVDTENYYYSEPPSIHATAPLDPDTSMQDSTEGETDEEETDSEDGDYTESDGSEIHSDHDEEGSQHESSGEGSDEEEGEAGAPHSSASAASPRAPAIATNQSQRSQQSGRSEAVSTQLVSPRFRQHTDGGASLAYTPRVGEVVDELPPSYQPYRGRRFSEIPDTAKPE